MKHGFTLAEVVVALLVVQVAVMGTLANLVLVHRTLSDAEQLELATLTARGTLDSLQGAFVVEQGSSRFEHGRVAWTVGDSGLVVVRAVSLVGDEFIVLRSRILPP
ncbi:MAG: hypothetical protein ACKVIN_14120 [Longimicrobiales bacterium]|jgi:type II secretory pathway pseudopilin PulG